MKRIGYFIAAAGLLLSLPSVAHTPQQPPHQLYSEGTAISGNHHRIPRLCEISDTYIEGGSNRKRREKVAQRGAIARCLAVGD